MQALALFRRTACGDSVLLETNKGLAQVYYQRGDFARPRYSFQLLKSAIAAGSVCEEANGYIDDRPGVQPNPAGGKGIRIRPKGDTPLVVRNRSGFKKLDILFKLSKRYLWHFQDTRAAKSPR